MENLQLNKEQLDKILEIRKDFYRYCKNNLKIKDKHSRIIPFVPNTPQRVLIDYVLLCIKEKRPVKAIILKARQMGLSTAVEAIIYWWTSTNKNINSVIIGHEESSSKNLYMMFRRYYDNTNPLFKPSVRYNTRTDLSFERFDDTGKQVGLGSSIKTATAGNRAAGRSDTINLLHACMHPDSPIILADGSSTTAGNIKVGDLVFTSSGAIAPVKRKFHPGMKDTIAVRVWGSNEPVYLTAEHKVLTAGGYKCVSDLTTDDWVRKPDYHFEELHSIDYSYKTPKRSQNGGTSVSITRTIDLDYDFGYLAGYYLAEGHVKKSGKYLNQLTFAYHKDEHYIENIRSFFASTRDEFSGNRGMTHCYDTYMAHLMNDLYGRTEDKHIPLFGNREYFEGLLQGYLDGDGSKTQHNRVSATSVHERIARNINRIGDMLGRHGGLSTREAGYYYGRNCKKTYINSFNDGVLKPHIRKYKWVDGALYVRIKSLTPYEPADVIDIEVDHPDHNFETPIGVISNSELGEWENGEDLVASLLETVPDEEVMDKPSMMFLESTAKGRGNYFHKEFVAAVKGLNNFEPFFFPWWILDTYERDFDVPLGKTTEYEDFLIDLMKKGHTVAGQTIHVDPAHIPAKIHFYRRKAKNFESTPERLPQEYPSTWQEAFIASGKNVFNTLSLQEMEKDAQPVEETEYYKLIPGELHEQYTLERVPFEPNEKPEDFTYKAPLKIWVHPKPGHEYVIGGDVAEGLKRGDYSVAEVVDIATMQTVARWRGHIDPDKFGEIVGALGAYYNYALVGVEVNNHGLTTIQKLRDTFYTNLYKRDKGYDEDFEEPTSNLGWKTDVRTKRIMIDDLIKIVRERINKDLDTVFINEAFAFVRDDRGRMNAEEGEHDDTVMAKAIAFQLFPWGDNDVHGLNVVKKTKKSKVINK